MIFIRYIEGGTTYTEVLDAPGTFNGGDSLIAYDGDEVVITSDVTIDIVGVVIYEYPLSVEDQAIVIGIDPWTWASLHGTIRFVPSSVALRTTVTRTVPTSGAVRR